MICTDTTAVSLYIQWRAGYDGGSDQTFIVTSTDTVTGIEHQTPLDGAGRAPGSTVQYRLGEEHSIQSLTEYVIDVNANNDNGETSESAKVTCATLGDYILHISLSRHYHSQ